MDDYYNNKHFVNIGNKKMMQVDPMFPASVFPKVKDFQFRSDDVLITSFPKTGTTWLGEVVWQIRNDADLARGRESVLQERMRFIEAVRPHVTEVDYLHQSTEPRQIKTHLWPEFFADDFLDTAVKVIVVVRNPKDALVSFYHFYKLLDMWTFHGNWDEFFDLMMKGNVYNGDFFDFYEHWWALRKQPNVLFVKYEDMKTDLEGGVRRIAKFLRKTLTEDMIETIVNATTFNAMSTNPSTNDDCDPKKLGGKGRFMRTGACGGWREFFSQEQSDLIDQMYRDRLLSQGLQLDFGPNPTSDSSNNNSK